jgi:hypothetical protein
MASSELKLVYPLDQNQKNLRKIRNWEEFARLSIIWEFVQKFSEGEGIWSGGLFEGKMAESDRTHAAQDLSSCSNITMSYIASNSTFYWLVVIAWMVDQPRYRHAETEMFNCQYPVNSGILSAFEQVLRN